MLGIVKSEGVVIFSAMQSFAVGMKDNGFDILVWFHHFDDFVNGNPAPVGNPRPSLNAMMHGDLILFCNLRHIFK